MKQIFILVITLVALGIYAPSSALHTDLYSGSVVIVVDGKLAGTIDTQGCNPNNQGRRIVVMNTNGAVVVDRLLSSNTAEFSKQELSNGNYIALLDGNCNSNTTFEVTGN